MESQKENKQKFRQNHGFALMDQVVQGVSPVSCAQRMEKTSMKDISAGPQGILYTIP
jgi:hypothetical protein